MTTFYEKVCAVNVNTYHSLESKKQALRNLIMKQYPNRLLLDAFEGKTTLKKLFRPIIEANLKVSWFKKNNTAFETSEFKESSKNLKTLEYILPVNKKMYWGDDIIPVTHLCLSVDLYTFYSVAEQVFLWCLCIAIASLLFFTHTSFLKALLAGWMISMFLELIFACLKKAIHLRTRRKMAKELLQQVTDIDRIFAETSLG